MSNFVQASDFESGTTKIPTTRYSVSELQAFIDEQEPTILRHLLGCDLYADFLADYLAAPTDEFSEDRFKDIYNPFCIDYSCGILESKGIVYLLKHLILYEYEALQEVTRRVNGFVKEKNDNSESSSSMQAGIFDLYNKGVLSYGAIQTYIKLNPKSYDYTKFNGTEKQYLTWF